MIIHYLKNNINIDTYLLEPSEEEILEFGGKMNELHNLYEVPYRFQVDKTSSDFIVSKERLVGLIKAYNDASIRNLAGLANYFGFNIKPYSEDINSLAIKIDSLFLCDEFREIAMKMKRAGELLFEASNTKNSKRHMRNYWKSFISCKKDKDPAECRYGFSKRMRNVIYSEIEKRFKREFPDRNTDFLEIYFS